MSFSIDLEDSCYPHSSMTVTKVLPPTPVGGITPISPPRSAPASSSSTTGVMNTDSDPSTSYFISHPSSSSPASSSSASSSARRNPLQGSPITNMSSLPSDDSRRPRIMHGVKSYGQLDMPPAPSSLQPPAPSALGLTQFDLPPFVSLNDVALDSPEASTSTSTSTSGSGSRSRSSNATITPNSAQHEEIPPPCSPRKHRPVGLNHRSSGVLVSQVRSRAGGAVRDLSPSPSKRGLNVQMQIPKEGSSTGMYSVKGLKDQLSEGLGSDGTTRDNTARRGQDGQGEEEELLADGSTISTSNRDQSSDAQSQPRRDRHDGSQEEADEQQQVVGDPFSMYDNSARFYYHPMHYSKSATWVGMGSDPNLQLQHQQHQQSSVPLGDLYARRAKPSNAEGRFEVDSNGGSPVNLSRSRSQCILRDGSFPSPTLSIAGLSADINSNGRLVILTPTTQEWQELGLDSLKALGGEGGLDSAEGSEKDTDQQKRRESEGNMEGEDEEGDRKRESWDSIITPPKFDDRSSLYRTHSVDALEAEPISEHKDSPGMASPDVGDEGGEGDLDRDRVFEVPAQTAGSRSIFSGDSSRDGSRSAPPLLEEGDLFARLLELDKLRRQDQGIRPHDVSPTSSIPHSRSISRPRTPIEQDLDHAHGHLGHLLDPLPSVGISRSQSLRGTGEKKKETERERLFRMVGEEVEREGLNNPTGSWGIRQIGSGLGLNYIPPTPPTDEKSPPDRTTALLERADRNQAPFFAATSQVQAHAATGSSRELPSTSLLAPPAIKSNTSGTLALSPLSNMMTLGSSSPNHHLKPLASAHSRSRAHSRSPSMSHQSLDVPNANNGQPDPSLTPITSRRRQSQRLSLLAGRIPQPFAFPAALPPSGPTGGNQKSLAGSGLMAYSPFIPSVVRSPPRKPLGGDALHRTIGTTGTIGPLSPIPTHLQNVGRTDSSISIAPSTTAPSVCGTPREETAGGMGGRGIDNYVILSEAGKGAYGLVKLAQRKGPDGQPVGEEVIIKYIIKSRILADCWKKHRVLGPIPIEIHVMDQLRNQSYNEASKPKPWEPERNAKRRKQIDTPGKENNNGSLSITPTNTISTILDESFPFGDWHSKVTLEAVKDRGHPNICKMLDFFEDREFYYRKYDFQSLFHMSLSGI